MLVLTRRFGETFMIGDTTKVTILGFRRGEVRVGIDAPTHIEVHRKEIYDRIQDGEVFPKKSRRQDVS